MKLTKIKMAGFKSFAEPITISFPSQWNCIVGPNGCGKSNTIDAIRCVMGESAAKQLRGGAMEDMIFNGCATRQPAGQASIELFFDNSDGTLLGPYAAYSEISVKRTVNRDGQSKYYLNGTTCRRKDVFDIFLGTGLGPRSYSIIEQGTISRVVEAKPMELRNYLEEAAGVSKYKERRRETENRIKHTRENLDRVDDLRSELDKQIKHLSRQADAAEKFQTLKAEARETDARRIVLNWKILDEERQEKSLDIEKMQTTLEEHLSKTSNVETLLTELDMEFADKQEDYNVKQAKVYETVAEINKQEQAISFHQEQMQKRNDELQQIESHLSENQEHLGGDQSRLESLLALKEELLPTIEGLREQHEMASERLTEAESRNSESQRAWEESQEQFSSQQRSLEVNQQKKEYLQAQIEENEKRLTEVQAELAEIRQEASAVDDSQLSIIIEEKSALLEQKQMTLDNVKENIQQAQVTIEEGKNSLDHLQERKQVLQGELSSLRALQKTALGKHQESLNDWLSQYALADCQRLAEKLDVDSSWSAAVETVLHHDLDAVCVSSLRDVIDNVHAWPEQSVTLYRHTDRASENQTLAGLPTLATKVKGQDVHPALNHIFAAETVSDALAVLSQCQAHQSIITKDGVWLSQSWLKIVKQDEAQAGILVREKTITQKEAELEQVMADIETQQIEVSNSKTQLSSLNEQAESLRQVCQDINGELAEVKAEFRALQSRQEEYRRRRETLQQSIERLQGQVQEKRDNLSQAIEHVEMASHALESLNENKVELEQSRSDAQSALHECREVNMSIREQLHEVEMRWKSVETELNSLDQAQSRLMEQIERLKQKKESLLEQTETQPQSIESMQIALEAALELKLKAEDAAREAKKHLEEHEHRRRELEQLRSASHHEIESKREKLERMRLQLQTVTVNQSNLMEKFEQTDFELQAVIDEMPDDASLDGLSKHLQSLESRIANLGAINLAAIDEFKTVSERKEYLDAQNEDLESALATLEGAIKKIDQETRTKLRETFEKINNKFQELFPRVFGGGQASLALTEQDWLTTGITIMARPPGKRNTSIHMLSGGEKALTAIAFVFSIFHLNPAPFCMLDEVDAPLDDANVERFCRLVGEMADTVKFIVISHNKLAISKAQNLIGVTMKEAGVSRIVSVDVDEAIKMSE